MKGIGLVFSGGGGKGAYQIGVWKYLHELGLDQYVRCVSGTSVGALNAALFSGGTYEQSENLWLNISMDKILTPRKITPAEIAYCFGLSLDQIPKSLYKNIALASAVAVSGMVNVFLKIALFLMKSLKTEYLFSREGIISLIREGISFEKVYGESIPCYATCFNCSTFTPDRFKLDDYNENEIISILLASSAIPVIFPSVEINGEKYYDGGMPEFGDNVPIKPVYDTGVENIIVVHLSQDTLIDKSMYPDVNIIEIVPSVDLGNALTGTMDFTPDGAWKRLNLGYNDAKRVLKHMIEMIEIGRTNLQILGYMKKSDIQFMREMEEKKKEESILNNRQNNDGFDALYNELN